MEEAISALTLTVHRHWKEDCGSLVRALTRCIRLVEERLPIDPAWRSGIRCC